MRRLWILLPVVVALVAAPAVVAELKEPPSEKELAAKAKALNLNKEGAARGKAEGKEMTLTPADLGRASEKDMEDGLFIGELDTPVGGKETKLPPGKYKLYGAKVNGKWHVYAVSDAGKIVGEAAKVSFETRKPKEGARARSSAEVNAITHCHVICFCSPTQCDCFVFCH
jgi:hypothetical protein